MGRSSSRPMRACLAAGAVFILFASLRADAVELVRDLNVSLLSRASYSGARGIDLPQGTLFPMVDAAHGTELWFTNGTPEGTRLVRDIYRGSLGGSPAWFNMIGNVAVFLAIDPIHGIELWRSDGTAPGTFMLADIGPGPISYAGYLAVGGGVYPQVVLNGAVIFPADDGVSGLELWRTDGTREGTYLLKDIVPGAGSSAPGMLTRSSTHVFFNGPGGIWVTDGTEAGTRLAANVGTYRFTRFGDKMYFQVDDLDYGTEMWSADADGSNVHMVANVNDTPAPDGGDGDGNGRGVFRVNNTTLFSGTIASGNSSGSAHINVLLRMDPSGTGATVIKEFGDSHVENVIALPNGALFSLVSSYSSELWVTDGTTAGTVPLDLDGVNHTYTPGIAYGDNGEAYFFGKLPGNDAPDKIWRTDGTRAGTRVFVDLPTRTRHSQIVFHNGRLYFDAGWGNAESGDELWTSDGTLAGTTMVKDLAPGPGSSFITDLRIANGKVMFFAGPVDTLLEPWISDGTANGTINLGNRAESLGTNTADSNVMFASQLGMRVLFAANSTSNGRELMATDGTRAGTEIVADINTSGSSDPDSFQPFGDLILFAAKSWNHARELWRTDGTAAGTFVLTNFGNDTTSITRFRLSADSVLQGITYFSGGTDNWNFRLWRTDGTLAGTSELPPASVGENVFVLGSNGTRLLYYAKSATGMHLWSWDGTQAEIIAVADGLKIATVAGVVHEGRVCFRAWDATLQFIDVWCANGLQGDLVRATNFAALNLSAQETYVLGNKLLVNAGGTGQAGGLYASFGIAASTQLISSERMASVKPYTGGQLVYSSEGGLLMVTDGTAAGTRNLVQGATVNGDLQGPFGVHGNFVVFMVNNPQSGTVIWRTDGTPAGTRYLADLDLGTEQRQRSDGQFFSLGDRLLFSGYRREIGEELWSINSTDPNASDDSVSGAFGATLVADVLANDADFDGTLNAASVTIFEAPLYGTATVNAATGAITFVPNAGYSGVSTLKYRVADNEGRQSNPGTLRIEIAAGSAPPPVPPPPSGGSSSGGGSSGSGGGGGAIGIELVWLFALVTASRLRRFSGLRRRVG